MPKQHAGYASAVDWLKPRMYGLPGKIIAIDGRNGVGKTTFGRFLAWTFNSTPVETDLYIEKGKFEYCDVEPKRVVNRRISKSQPVIVDGVAILWILRRLDLAPDYHIYVRNPLQSDDEIDRAGVVGHEERMVVVVWRPRGATRRIISLRKANDREQKIYGKRLGRP